MTLLRPRLFLAMSGAVCLIALVPQWRRPPVELAAIDRSPIGSARVNARLSTTDARIDKIVPFAAAAPAAAIRSLPGLDAPFGEAPPPPRTVGFSSACCARAISDASTPPAPEQAATSDASLAAQLAYADVPGAAPAESALAAISPSLPAVVLAPGELPPPPPLSSVAAILYNKGDAAGLAALAKAANDPARRMALEWASLRANAHPSFTELAAFLEAHPTWPSRGSLRDRQEGELAAHPQAPAKVAEFFAGGAPQTSAGKIAAARAAKAMGRNDEASQNNPSLMARRKFRRPDRRRHPARLRRFARQGRSQISRRPPALRRLRRRRRARLGACRPGHSGADRSPDRGGARADDRRAGQGRSAGAPQ